MLYLYDCFDSYYVFFYMIQRYVSSLLFVLSNLSSNYLFLFVFFLGFFTVFTPCLLSLLPLVLSYINSKQSYNLSVPIFIVGITTSIMFFIVSTNLVSFSFFVYKLPVFSYIILIMVALNLMEILVISKINIFFQKYLDRFAFNNILLQSYSMGLVIGSSTLPCNTSFLLILNFLLHKIDNPLLFFLYLFVYLIGFSFPLLLISKINFNYVNIFVLSSFWKLIFPLTGSFIFIFSCFSLLKIIFI